MPSPDKYGQLIAALIGFTSATSITLIAAWVGYRRYLHERTHQQEALLNALFGELANIYEHYSHAAMELPTTTSDSMEVRKRLQWSMYGTLHSTQEVSRYGFLSAADIRLLLQLALRVRNNDHLFTLFLNNLAAVTLDDLRSAKARMRYPINTAQELLNRLVDKRPKLKSVLIEIQRDLPTIQE